MTKSFHVFITGILFCAILTALAGHALSAGKSFERISPVSSVSNPYGLKPDVKDTKKIFELFPLNIRIFRWFNSWHNPVLDRIALFMDTLYIPFEKMHMRADIGLAWVLIPVLLFAWFKKRHLFLTLLIGLLLETLLVVITKHQWSQPRPGAILMAVHEVQQLRNNSFPSGHAAMMCVITGVMIYRSQMGAVIFWFALLAVVSWQRLYTGCHFPLDMAVGLLIGIVSSVFAVLLMKKTMDKMLEKSKARTDPQKSGAIDNV
jgi:membrane-associated phospholipid phosphatase